MKSSLKTMFLFASLLLAHSALAAHPESVLMQEDDQVVNEACSADAKAAGCGDIAVHKGLLSCINSYKKSHSDFQISAECKAARKKRQVDKKAGL